jgi:hypothetical protein
MENDHLIPVIVQDCVRYMLDKNTNQDARNNFEQRVEAIRSYCEDALRMQKLGGRR